jgi:undecaprenyl-diphosphatase
MAAAQPATLCAQQQGGNRFARWAYRDGAGLVREIVPRTPLWLAGGMALASASAVDAALQGKIQRRYHGPLASYLNFTNELGGPWATPAVAGIFGVALAAGDDRLQDAAFTSLQSLVYAGVITRTLKASLGRYRPEQLVGAYHFQPFSGHTSFPSGHTTAVFAIVTPWVMYYPGVATYGLFALAAGTATARVARDKHWPTDVLAGAAIGILTGRHLARRHITSERQRRIQLRPALLWGESGVMLRLGLTNGNGRSSAEYSATDRWKLLTSDEPAV